MVRSCAAWGCTNREEIKRSALGNSNRSSDVTFHRFPLTNKLLLAKWIAALKRKDFKPTKCHRVCSKHFLMEDYDDAGFRRRLKQGVVPSIFTFPSHLQRSVTPRKIVKRKLVSKTKKTMPVTNVIELNKLIMKDHNYTLLSKKQTLRSTFNLATNLAFKRLRRKLRTEQQKARRAKKRILKLKDCLQSVKNKKLIDGAAKEILENAFGGMSLYLFKHLLRRSKDTKKRPAYNNQLKTFAVTLNYLSPKAYDYLRPTLSLPHPATLRTWRSSVAAEPGFLTQALDVAQKLASKSGNVCSLLLDEMSLRKQVQWCQDRHQFSGHIDFGGGPVNNTVASNALVFMLVSLKSSWKTPIAYFLTNHVDSQMLSRSITDALLKTADRGILVKVVVADGLKVNMSAAQHLGCQFSALNPLCYFRHPHPNFHEEFIWYSFDPPHMLKLIRNLLGDTKRIYVHTATDKKPILWSYVESLHNLQKTESLYLANKITGKHINYHNLKMKVNIAAQTLSSSVATALDHLRDDLNLSQFQGSQETCHFIRMIDKLFDRLNARNPFAKGSKAALSNNNRHDWISFFNNAIQYLLTLFDCQGRPLYTTSRGTAIVGFIVSATTASELTQNLLDRHHFKYVLPYKFCQDHLEMFFGKIRQGGGSNNNPTAEQFRHCIRALLLKNEVKAPIEGNAISQMGEVDDNIYITTSKFKKPVPPLLWNDHMVSAMAQMINGSHFSSQDWQTSCLVYTAGYVCRKVAKIVKCIECKMALFEADPQSMLENSFFERKNRGGLTAASHGVASILKATEKAFRILMPSACHMEVLPHEKFIDLRIKLLVISLLQDKLEELFPTLKDHFNYHELGSEEPHHIQLLKMIVDFFLTMKLKKAGKLHHERSILKGLTSKRKTYTKIILFSGQ